MRGGMTAAEFRRSRGRRVEAADDIPGLFRVDGGPEITLGQLAHMARQDAG